LRVLGEGQLSLTKFLIVTDGDVDITDFRALWMHVLARVNWEKDLFVFANVSQDTLDYTGPSVNKGSKAMLLGLGKEPRRTLADKRTGPIPSCCSNGKVFLPGTLVVQTASYAADPVAAKSLATSEELQDWPIIFLVDDVNAATASMQEFLWTIFTRFEPANDIYARTTSVHRFHVGLQGPVVIDCRMKPWYTEVLEVDPVTKKLVDDKITKIIPKPWR
jgi:3-polyprenyl-4-hydroxybenzoate decarboxylase